MVMVVLMVILLMVMVMVEAIMVVVVMMVLRNLQLSLISNLINWQLLFVEIEKEM